MTFCVRAPTCHRLTPHPVRALKQNQVVEVLSWLCPAQPLSHLGDRSNMDQGSCDTEYDVDIFELELELSCTGTQQYSKGLWRNADHAALPGQGQLPEETSRSHVYSQLQKILSWCLALDAVEMQVGARFNMSR